MEADCAACGAEKGEGGEYQGVTMVAGGGRRGVKTTAGGRKRGGEVIGQGLRGKGGRGSMGVGAECSVGFEFVVGSWFRVWILAFVYDVSGGDEK